MNIKPLYDRVVIKPQAKKEKTESGIYIPETVDKERPQMGEIIAVGEGKIMSNGDVKPLKVKVGDKVLFSKYGPTEITLEGEEYLITKEEELLAII